jgi:hypothetical protein
MANKHKRCENCSCFNLCVQLGNIVLTEDDEAIWKDICSSVEKGEATIGYIKWNNFIKLQMLIDRTRSQAITHEFINHVSSQLDNLLGEENGSK